MSLHAISLHSFPSFCPTDSRFSPLPSPSNPFPTLSFRPSAGSSAKRKPFSTRRLSPSPRATSALFSETTSPIRLTYLEVNSWLWDFGGVSILVDPLLVGNLDFGLPWLFDGAKKVLKKFQLEDLPEIDFLVITQSLDDHCHVRTLTRLSKKLPDLPVIATPNAEGILRPLFNHVIYLEPGQSFDAEGRCGARVNICATAGPILGPPWQRPENGYLLKCGQSHLSLYYEPHCVYNHAFLQKYKADIIVTPVIKQLLPFFTLVSGQQDAVQLAKLLQAKYIVPMKNGDIDSKGILSSILRSEGTIESFEELLSRELPDAQILEPTPGVPLEISISSTVSECSV